MHGQCMAAIAKHAGSRDRLLSVGATAAAVASVGLVVVAWARTCGGSLVSGSQPARSAAQLGAARPCNRLGWSARVSRGRAKQHNGRTLSPIVVCENVDEYRRVIPELIQSTDIVLEVGCHEGITTSLINVIAARTVGVDKSTHCIPKACTRFPSCEFLVADVLSHEGMAKIQALQLRFDVIFVDVSGSRDLRTLIPLIEQLDCIFKPRLLVVKGYKLRRLYNRLVRPGDTGDAQSSKALVAKVSKLRAHKLGPPPNASEQLSRDVCPSTISCSACGQTSETRVFSAKQRRKASRAGGTARCIECTVGGRSRSK